MNAGKALAERRRARNVFIMAAGLVNNVSIY
jgi:hypothetical protein